MATFVLVHGAFLGGWCWRLVASRLRAAGHDVFTPTLTGCGDRFHLLTREVSLATHAQDLEQTLVHEDLRDVILVGHSYGGTVMTTTAPRVVDRVQKLVYLDAQAPTDGQSASGGLADGASERLAELTAGEAWLLDPVPLEAMGVTDPHLVQWVAPRRHSHPMRTLLEPVHVPPGTLDRITPSYVVCKRHAALAAFFGTDPLAPFVERARREGWRIEEIDAPHDAMTVAPDVVANVLLGHV